MSPQPRFSDQVLTNEFTAHFKGDAEVQLVASNNDIQQFGVYMGRRIDDGIVERHEANASIVKSYFENEGFKEILDRYIVETLYQSLKNTG